MLAAVFTMLKWLGVLLLGIISLILAVCLCVLFVPVRYRIQASIGEEGRRMRGRASWLLHLVHVTVQSDGEGTRYRIRICGIPLPLTGRKEERDGMGTAGGRPRRKKDLERRRRSSRKRPEKKGAEKRNSDGSGGARGGAPPGKAERMDDSGSRTDTGASCQEIRGEGGGDSPKTGIRLFFARIKDFVLSIRTIFVRIKRAVHRIFAGSVSDKSSDGGEKGMFARVREIIQDEATPQLLELLWGSTGRFVRYIRPSRVKGWIHFGHSDPCITGQILGIIGILSAVWGQTVEVVPDFERAILEGEIELAGRLQAVRFLYIVGRLHPFQQWRHYKKYM